MPINKTEKKRYPENWSQIRQLSIFDVQQNNQPAPYCSKSDKLAMQHTRFWLLFKSPGAKKAKSESSRPIDIMVLYHDFVIEGAKANNRKVFIPLFNKYFESKGDMQAFFDAMRMIKTHVNKISVTPYAPTDVSVTSAWHSETNVQVVLDLNNLKHPKQFTCCNRKKHE